ncbi:hypothetical protein GCM10010885_01110 [Alicyclobacillus cellulosilyticus]|uniref:Site-specific DNA-methyltransferase (adenine-specific) n=1 Tax=Alicyclobacillus cellulosilyticus TaxID=1003997 RepID=A0A917JZX0_9BACL|nr:Dam family site-specific DNA-(adenine-N6)-methyltransferase [Alicyclobacillus cellulosilyticus]GGI95300.1 hypothetical protein GCM10010885_01110 [Alicyclobacillus cellulosilyticus]
MSHPRSHWQAGSPGLSKPSGGEIRGCPPSLIKWTGSKRYLAAQIARHFPDRYRRFVDPFLGSGALLYFGHRGDSLAGDAFAPLVAFWRLVQTDVEAVIRDYSRQWVRLQTEGPAYFYAVRERFNQAPNPLDLCFLTRTCVNGIIRFNARGEFNNSFHLSRPGMRPERFARMARRWASRLQGVHLVCQDYRDTLAAARPGDFVYLDPPYARTRQRYADGVRQRDLIAALADLNRRGVRWALSYDGRRGAADFTQPLPAGLYKHRILLYGGASAVRRVLHGAVEPVHESLYLNYDPPG